MDDELRKYLDNKFDELRAELRKSETVDPKHRGAPFNPDGALKRLLSEMESRITDRISKLEGKKPRFGPSAGPG